MTTPDWRTEPTGTRMTGTVTYRCATCGDLIPEGQHVMWSDGRTIRTYHPDHVPQQGDADHGR